MDICGQILDDTEEKDWKFNESIYELVLNEFLDSIDEFITFDKDWNEIGDKVRCLKNQYIYTSKYVELFFDILKNNNYYMKQEIKDAMFNLGHLKNPNKNKKVIELLLNSPVIQDISFNGKNEFLISSAQYGDFSFELASHYFKKNSRVRQYMKHNELCNRCHVNAYELSHEFPNLYSITSFCRMYFGGYYFHSYTYNKEENRIIDLCYNSIMNKDDYYKIFEPQDISIILNSEVEKELLLTDSKTEQYYDRCELLKIALYKEYLNGIGYCGSLEEAPSIKSLKKI